MKLTDVWLPPPPFRLTSPSTQKLSDDNKTLIQSFNNPSKPLTFSQTELKIQLKELNPHSFESDVKLTF